MGNKLKKVFNKNKISYKGSIRFNDNAIAKNFDEALKAVFERGETVHINGNAAMSWGIESGSGIFPFANYKDVTDIVVGPSVENREIMIDVDGKKVAFTIEYFSLNNGFVIQTSQKFPFELKMIFNKIQKNVNLNFSPHIEKASSVDEFFLSIKQIKGLLKKFFIQNINYKDTDLNILKNVLDEYYNLFDRLNYVEQKMNIKFDIQKIDFKDDYGYKDLYELCLLLREKKVLKVNTKTTSMEEAAIKFQQSVEVQKNEPIVLTFLSDITYMVWGKTCKLYGAFFVGNAIAKDIIKLENGSIRVIYGDNEIKPMYLAYKGYLTEDEASEELRVLLTHKEEYENAKTVEQYWNEH